MKKSQFPKKSGRMQGGFRMKSFFVLKDSRNSLKKAGECKSTSQVIDTSHIQKVK